MEQPLSHYKIFYTVANEGTISRAAAALFVSQPAVSKAIQKLEHALGVTLFFRNSRGVQLTEEGVLLYKHVKMAFEALTIGEEQLRQTTELGIGHLRIGVSSTLCKYVLLPYLKHFIQQYPHIYISISCQSTNHTLQLLKDGKIDIGLIGKPASPANISFFPIGEIEDIFVSTEDYINHLNFRNPELESTMFPSATLMLLDRENMTRQYINDYLRINQIDTNNLLEITSMDLLIEFAKIGLGVACVIKQFVREELRHKTLVNLPLRHPIPKREIGFACLSAGTQNHFVKTFLAFSFDSNIII